MATIYNTEITSDWINYNEEYLRIFIQELIDPDKLNIRVTKVVRKQ